MKLTKYDYILLLNNVILICILGYLYYKLEYESGIFKKNNILDDICKIERNNDKKLKGTLANKIKVKEYNQKHFPDLKHAITFKILNIKKTDKEYVYKYAEDYDFKEIYSSLPKQYIIKCSVGGFNHHIVKQNNLQELKETCDKLLHIQIPRIVKEAELKNQYQHLQYSPQIYIEEYLGDNLIDYKFLMINGKIVFLKIGQQYTIPKTFKLYNEDGVEMPNILNIEGDNKNKNINLPHNFSNMKNYCYKIYNKTKLPFIRIDFYEVNNKVYFGEYTFTTWGCNVVKREIHISNQVNNYFKQFLN